MFYDKKYYLQKRNPDYYNYARLQQASGHNLQKTYNVNICRNSSNSRLFHHHFFTVDDVDAVGGIDYAYAAQVIDYVIRFNVAADDGLHGR